jgi:hypothetical protein
MKSMQKQAQQPLKGREEKGPIVQIKLGGGKANEGAGASEGGGVKKGGFKKGGFKSAFGSASDEQQRETTRQEKDEPLQTGNFQDYDSDITDEEDYYDPRKPTGCMPGCKSRASAVVR